MKIVIQIVLCLLFTSLHLDVAVRIIPAFSIFFITFFILMIIVVLQYKEPSIRLTLGGVLIFCFCFLYLSGFLIKGNVYGTPILYISFTCWGLYFVLNQLFYKNKDSIRFVFRIIVVTIFIEFILGFCQLFGWLNNQDAHFRLGGSFGNPGAYAGYLAAVSPLLLSVLLIYHRRKKFENLYYLLIVCMGFIMYMIFMSKSRGALLAYSLGCALVLNHRFSILKKVKSTINSPLRRILVTTGCILAIACSGLGLYHLKADSAFGRILVWKVTALTPHHHLLLGNGIGYFEANYGKWQSAYFANSGGTEAERYVADYVTCAYNEFIEGILEHGILAGLLFIFIFYFALKQRNRTDSFVMGAKVSLAAILVLMCFSYPLKIVPIYLYMIFCMAVIFSDLSKRGFYVKSIKLPFIKWSFLLAGVLIVMVGLRDVYGYYQLGKGQQYVFLNQLEKGLEAYTKASVILENSGIFHFYNGSALALTQQYKASAKELEKSIITSSNPNSYILLGNVYKELGKPEAAKQAYYIATNMIPSKLYPKYLMAKLLYDISEYREAEKWAREILNTKEKIPTTAAKEIKQEMEALIHSIKKNDRVK